MLAHLASLGSETWVGVAYDASTNVLYFDKYIAGEIVALDLGDGTQTTVVTGLISEGTGGVASDGDGTLVVTEWNGDVSNCPADVLKFDVTTMPATKTTYVSQEVCYPDGPAFAPDGTVYVAERGGRLIRRIDPITQQTTVLIDNFTLPLNVSVTPGGDLLVPDAGTGTVYRIDPTAPQKDVLGTGFGEVYSAVEDANGRIYVASMDLNAIFRLTPNATDPCAGAANGTPCDDGNACTPTDTCQAGVCTGVSPSPCATSAIAKVEGESIAFVGTIVAPVGTNPSYVWDFGNGTPTASGKSVSYAYPDNGVFSATMTASSSGGSFVEKVTATISNAAPTITSTPSTTGQEAQQYTYTVTFTDAGTADVVTCSAPIKPAGSALAGCQLTWTPDFSQAIGAPVPIKMCVTDDDGAEACQDFNVTVAFLDSDHDTVPDSWEISNFGNITSQDQFGDPDGDGLNNLQEFTNVTDPLTYDGPNAPVPTAPTCGSEIASLQTTLQATNAVDPQGTPLRYQFQLFSDVGLTVLVAEVADGNTLIPEGVGTTAWPVTVNLVENTRYFWRVRAKDPFTFGPFSAPACSFFVNAANEAPGIPGINSPLDGAQVNSFTPALRVDNASDPDQDALKYQFEVYADQALTNRVAASPAAGEAEGAGGTTAWAVTAAVLQEDRPYFWRARAVDPDNLAGGWSATGEFFVSTTNAPPEPPSIVSPQNGTTVGELRPSLVIASATDSDLDPLVYDWDLATDVAFTQLVASGANAPPQGAGNTTFGLNADLQEDHRYCWRVRADDGQATSSYVTSCFLVYERNDPPSVPTLNNPSDNQGATTTTPVFSWAPSTDPEDEAITYEIEVKDAAGTIVGTVTGVSGTVTSVSAELTNRATYTWRARATDASGAASDFSPENTFTVNAPVDEPEVVVNSGGCASGGGAGTAGCIALAIAALGFAGRRRYTGTTDR